MMLKRVTFRHVIMLFSSVHALRSPLLLILSYTIFTPKPRLDHKLNLINNHTFPLSFPPLLPKPLISGSALICEVSARDGEGIDALVEGLLLQADVMELKAARAGQAEVEKT